MSDPGSTRQRLLEAGMALLLDDGLKVLNRGLNVTDIAERAGVTEKTFFATFRSKDRYVDELLAALTVAPERVADGLTEVIQQKIIATAADPRQVIREVCAWDFVQVRDDPSMLRQMAVLVLARGHAKAIQHLRAVYATYDAAGVRAYEAILAKWGASLRAPFSAATIALTLTALVEGLAMRALVEPTAVPDDLFGNIVLAIVASVVDADQSHQHIDDVVAPIADEVMLTYDVTVVDGLPDDPRKAIADGAELEFSSRGFYATTPSHISVRSNVPLPMLRQLFPSKAAIVVSALKPQFEELRRQVDDDRSLGILAADVVKRYLGRLAAFAMRNPVFVEALLMIAAHDTASSPETAVDVKRDLDLPGLIAPVIEIGQHNGDFESMASAYDIAALLVNTLLLRCFTRKEDAPSRQAEIVGQICLGGLTRSRPT